ncbi:MAG: hypothetical protein BWY17_02000 [Deltaproteobacteria bacterium ADurb.Bin207]|nr:MAG: hypothetical protein BWY17_02000 [Deltaproteobacteria bacterium ADurb.Bin207]
MHDYSPPRFSKSARSKEDLAILAIGPKIALPFCVLVAVTTHQDRVSPVCDVARCFLVVETDGNREIGRSAVTLDAMALYDRARRMTSFGWDVLICGAISRPFQMMLTAGGLRVIPNTCGAVQDVVRAFFDGSIDHGSFRMPGCGCCGRGRRRRRGR